jgi:hypothetical protein
MGERSDVLSFLCSFSINDNFIALNKKNIFFLRAKLNIESFLRDLREHKMYDLGYFYY